MSKKFEFKPDQASEGVDYLYYTQVIVCDAANNEFELTCPFIPDTISTHMVAQASIAAGNAEFKNIATTLNAGASTIGAAVQVQTATAISNDLGLDNIYIAVCNFANTYNPVLRHSNMSRKEFKGKYKLEIKLGPSYSTSADGYFLVTLEFSRKRTKDDR